MSQVELIEQKAAHRELDDKWTELRCCGFFIGSTFCHAKHPFRSDSCPKKVLRRLHQCMEIILYSLATGKTMNAHATLEIRKARHVSRLGALGKHNNTNIELHASIHAYIYICIHIYIYILTHGRVSRYHFFGFHRPDKANRALSALWAIASQVEARLLQVAGGKGPLHPHMTSKWIQASSHVSIVPKWKQRPTYTCTFKLIHIEICIRISFLVFGRRIDSMTWFFSLTHAERWRTC